VPSLFAQLAVFVGKHRRYFVGVGLGGFALLFATAGVLALLGVLIPWYVSEAFFWAAYIVVVHWPFLIAAAWFHPARGVLRPPSTGASALRRGAYVPVAWVASTFLLLFFVASAVGPIWAYRPFFLFGVGAA